MRNRSSLILSCALAGACFDPNTNDDGGGSSSGGLVDTSATTMVATTGASATSEAPTTSPMTTTDPTATTDPTDPTATMGDTTGGPGEPEIDVTVEGQPVATTETFAIGETVDVGMMGTAVTVTVENIGTADLMLTGVLGQGPNAAEFTIDQAALPATLGPTESGTFTVQFAPASGGLKNATLSIGSDDADEDPYEINLTAHTTPMVFRPLMPMPSPTGRFNHAMAPLSDGRLVMFGGRDAAGVSLADTWVFDSTTDTWSQVMGMGPPPRFAHEMAWAGSDTIVLYGGTPGPGQPPLGDTWIFDGATNSWSPLMSPSPPGRFQHMMAPIGGGNVLMYGGRAGAGAGNEINESWRFAGATQTWMNLGAVPAGPNRSGSAMAFDGADTVTLFGGFDEFNPFDSTVTYSVAGNGWTAQNPPMNPGSRAVLQGVTLLDGRMYVFSGKLDSCCVNPSPGTFAYDPAANTWSDITPAMEPTPRFNYAFETIPGTNRAILFGGVLENPGSATAQADTWEYVGAVP